MDPATAHRAAQTIVALIDARKIPPARGRGGRGRGSEARRRLRCKLERAMLRSCICEECSKPIPEGDILAFQEESNGVNDYPRICHDCAEKYEEL